MPLTNIPSLTDVDISGFNSRAEKHLGCDVEHAREFGGV